MSTSGEGFEATLAETMPELHARMAEQVEDVEFSALGACLRCGVIPESQKVHRQWHRDLTFGMHAERELMLELAARLKDVLDEMDAADLEALLERRARAKAVEGG